jgi:hypothetical protein
MRTVAVEALQNPAQPIVTHVAPALSIITLLVSVSYSLYDRPVFEGAHDDKHRCAVVI